ncbi:MAG: ABC transporter ATP-binding protein [Deltaproteobacteria bacterium]|nr:MAG: ABC transporter ATP-binding protein [Deltaproteobacteria bacterium]
MIELKNLTKRYGNTLAVNNLNLSVSKGEIYGFIGPNGAGKTTTIRIMGGVLAPTEGMVVIDGINMADDPESVKRRIGFIPDRPFIYEKLTGMEFMRFSADLYGVDERIFLEKAQALLKQFAIFNWADELIESYSHGMKQRLIISSALLHDPIVIIVDEPMVGLDPAAIKMVKNMFRELSRGGMTIFMSTHTLAVAEDICDRIGVIHRGTLIATGTTGDLKRDAGVEEADLEEVFLILTEGQQI